MVATGPAKLVASQTPEEGSKLNVNSIKQMCDLRLATLVREGHAIQASHLSEAGTWEFAK